MTAQVHDRLLVYDQELDLVGVNGGELFAPRRYGLRPFRTSTACRRGYVCHYAVRDDRLVLDQLFVSLELLGGQGRDRYAGQAGPAINGVSPIFPNEQSPHLNNRYDALNLETPFSGGLLAGAGFIRELYVHMGFHPAWKYQTVYELIVFAGQVTEVRNVSEGLVAIREAMSRRPLRPGPDADETELLSWIASTFKLHYDL